MALTFQQLMAFNEGDYKTSAASWGSWADAVLKHSSDLKTNVADPLQAGWSGTAAANAQSNLDTVQGEMTVSADRISAVQTALTSAAATIGQAKRDAQAAVDTLGKGFTVGADGTVAYPPDMNSQDRSKWQPTVTAAQKAIQAALAKAQQGDQDVADALSGSMPPPHSPTDLSNNPSVGDHGPGSATAPGTGPPMTSAQRQTYQDLEKLWIQAGGDPAKAAMAAAIAMAESGGNPNAFNGADPAGGSRGLWQINGVWGSESTFDPLANARAAVAISHNGTNWNPWGTYTSGAYGRYLA